eukprot:1194992-Prorocentrum_minimum.AAC.9
MGSSTSRTSDRAVPYACKLHRGEEGVQVHVTTLARLPPSHYTLQVADIHALARIEKPLIENPKTNRFCLIFRRIFREKTSAKKSGGKVSSTPVEERLNKGVMAMWSPTTSQRAYPCVGLVRRENIPALPASEWSAANPADQGPGNGRGHRAPLRESAVAMVEGRPAHLLHVGGTRHAHAARKRYRGERIA